jgi:hypothetical protein
MSITKNTRRRKKVAPRNALSVSPAEQQGNRATASQKAEGPWSVVNDDIHRLLRSVSAARRIAYAALFHAAMMELYAAWRRPSVKRRRAVAEFIRGLEQESRNRRYRRILRALAEAAEESEEEMKAAYQMARLAVQVVFEWSADYRFVFGDYKPKRKPSQ